MDQKLSLVKGYLCEAHNGLVFLRESFCSDLPIEVDNSSGERSYTLSEYVVVPRIGEVFSETRGTFANVGELEAHIKNHIL